MIWIHLRYPSRCAQCGEELEREYKALLMDKKVYCRTHGTAIWSRGAISAEKAASMYAHDQQTKERKP